MDTNAPHSLRRSFELHLRAENRAPNTIAGYLESIRQAEAFLASRGKTLQNADRADVEAFLADLLSRRSASTAATRYKGLRVLYAWLEEEEEEEEVPNPWRACVRRSCRSSLCR
jgi:site-specific recombinase XerD